MCALGGVGQCHSISGVGQCIAQVIRRVGPGQRACGVYVLLLLIEVAFDGGSQHQWVSAESVKG